MCEFAVGFAVDDAGLSFVFMRIMNIVLLSLQTKTTSENMMMHTLS